MLNVVHIFSKYTYAGHRHRQNYGPKCLETQESVFGNCHSLSDLSVTKSPCFQLQRASAKLYQAARFQLWVSQLRSPPQLS